MQDPRDELRQKVLEYFYELYNQNPLNTAVADDISKRFSTYKYEEVLGAVEYLVDEKYLKIKKMTLDPFAIEEPEPQYAITPKGQKQFVQSKFSAKPASSLSFNMNGGIFVNGDNLGRIKLETVQSFEEITELIKKILESEKLSDAKKREAIGDAETIRAQMTKPRPDKSILSKAFENLQYLGGVIEAVNIIRSIAEMLHPYIK